MSATSVIMPEYLAERISEVARVYNVNHECLALAALALVVAHETKISTLCLLLRGSEIALEPGAADDCLARLTIDDETSPIRLARDFAALLASHDASCSRAVAPRGPDHLLTNVELGALNVQDHSNMHDPAFDDWVSGYYRLLHSCVVDPDMPLEHHVRALDPQWYAEATRWNDTAVAYAPGSVLSLLRAIIDVRPDQPAIIAANGAIWTYSALNRAANRIARLLRHEGVVPGDAVAVAIDRSPNLVAAMLACFKLGAIYVPVNYRDPIARIESGLASISARVMLVDGVGPDPSTLRMVELATADAYDDDDIVDVLTPDMAAYAIFTSGSTGQPKLVVVEHGALYNQLCWLKNTFPLDWHDKVAFKYIISFDASLGEMLIALIQGATLITAGVETDHRTDLLLETLIAGEVTVIDIVPSHLDALLRHDRFDQLHALRLVIVGGEAIHKSTARKFVDMSGAEFWNLYGPTEATITTIAGPIDVSQEGSIAIGKPIANVRAYLLDENLQPLPPGEVGEICLAGAQLARGYAGQVPDAQSAFVENPFLTGTRLYRTGDLGRRSADGSIKIEGRRDFQQSLRGLRLEPAEVEAALLDNPEVIACAVGVIDIGERPRLAAWIIPDSNAILSPLSLQNHMAKRLPVNMIPTAFYKVATLPRTAAGKLDRRALLSSCGEPLHTSPGCQPASDMERVVADAFTALLGFKPSDVNLSFFELGGDSLAAVLLVEQLTNSLGIMLEVNDVFEAPTVSGLAARAQKRGAVPFARKWRIVPDDGRLEVNAAQRQILDFESGGIGIAPTCLAVRWAGPLDLINLRYAFARTIARHPLLHSIFVKTDAHWKTQPLEELTMSIDHRRIDLAALGDADVSAQLPAAWLMPFEADRDPLIRMGVLQIAENETILLIAAHPAACDRMSIELVLRDLSRFYFHLTNECAEPRPLSVTADDHRRWLAEILAGGNGVKVSDRTRHLANFLEPTMHLDSDASDSAAVDSRNGRLTRIIAGSTPDRLEQVAHRRGVEMEALVAAALFQASEHRAKRLSVVGLPISGRQGLTAIEGVVGCFADYHLLFAPPAGLQIEEILEIVQRDLALAREEYSLPLAHELALMGAHLNFCTVPDVTFRYQRVHPMESGTTALNTIPIVPFGHQRRLSIDIVQHDSEIIVTTGFQLSRHNEQEMDEFIDHFLSVINLLAQADRD